MRRMATIIMIAIMCSGILFAQGKQNFTGPTPESLYQGISPHIWETIRGFQIRKQKPNENDTIELYSRIILVLKGSPLDPEARRRTITLANNVNTSVNIVSQDGLKWITAVFMAELENTVKKITDLQAGVKQLGYEITQLRNDLEDKDKEIEQLRSDIQNIKQANEQNLAKLRQELQSYRQATETRFAALEKDSKKTKAVE